jgi:hypothetical protein
MLTESRDVMRFRKSSQILPQVLAQITVIASLSSPQFDANPISAASGNVPDLLGFTRLNAVPYR